MWHVTLWPYIHVYIYFIIIIIINQSYWWYIGVSVWIHHTYKTVLSISTTNLPDIILECPEYSSKYNLISLQEFSLVVIRLTKHSQMHLVQVGKSFAIQPAPTDPLPETVAWSWEHTWLERMRGWCRKLRRQWQVGSSWSSDEKFFSVGNLSCEIVSWMSFFLIYHLFINCLFLYVCISLYIHTYWCHNWCSFIIC